jgi:N-acetylneuraminate synthase
MHLAGRHIDAGQPCFVIAEAGVNHNGDVQLAHRLIDAARAAGADAVKFQTFCADKLTTATAVKADYQVQNTHTHETQQEMLRALELSAEEFGQLAGHCREVGILFLSTPFDHASVDLLVKLGVPAIKVPSGEVTHTSLLRHMAATGLPLIISTGMSTMDEVSQCVATLRERGPRQIALLHCLSSYPADPAQINLRAMATLRDAFHLPVGLSDHTVGLPVALAAVALGGCILEKHLTLDRQLPGPDHACSLEPGDFSELVRGVRQVESALGDGNKRVMSTEQNTRDVARRSVATAASLPAGHRLRSEDLVALRPGTGIPPTQTDALVGRTLRIALPAGALLRLEDCSEA